MLHDPEMEVTCDGDDCQEHVFLPMTWSVGGYDLSDTDAERVLDGDHYWLTVGDDHFCEICRKEFDGVSS